jgi:hypothetical protein
MDLSERADDGARQRFAMRPSTSLMVFAASAAKAFAS